MPAFREKSSPNVEGKITMDAAYLYGQLERERQENNKWIEKYHQADKERGVLESKKNSSTLWGMTFSFLLTIAGSLFVMNFGYNLTTGFAVLLFFVALFGSAQNLRK